MIAADLAPPAAISARRVLRDGAVVAMTAFVIAALALLPLLTPWVMHPILDTAGSSAWLRLDAATTHALSDRTVEEWCSGPAPGRPSRRTAAFFDASEVQPSRTFGNCCG